MKIKNIMRSYYHDRLDRMEEIPPPGIRPALPSKTRAFFLYRNRDRILGYLFIGFSILHFIVTGRLFAVDRLLMAVSVVF
jgi:hypothetical protein